MMQLYTANQVLYQIFTGVIKNVWKCNNDKWTINVCNYPKSKSIPRKLKCFPTHFSILCFLDIDTLARVRAY